MGIYVLLEWGLEEVLIFCGVIPESFWWKSLFDKVLCVPAACEAGISFPGKGRFQSLLAVPCPCLHNLRFLLAFLVKSLKYSLGFSLQDCSSKWALPGKTLRLADIMSTLRTSQTFLDNMAGKWTESVKYWEVGKGISEENVQITF